MTYASGSFRGRHRDGLLSAVSVGFFFLLIGMLFITTLGLTDKVISFVQDFVTNRVPNTNVYLPSPASPRAHLTVYSAAEQFSLIWAVFLLAILAGRIVLRSPLRREAENLGDAVFWSGAAYLIQTYLVDKTRWFEFWSGVIIMIGISLIVRAIFLAAVLRSTR